MGRKEERKGVDGGLEKEVTEHRAARATSSSNSKHPVWKAEDRKEQ